MSEARAVTQATNGSPRVAAYRQEQWSEPSTLQNRPWQLKSKGLDCSPACWNRSTSIGDNQCYISIIIFRLIEMRIYGRCNMKSPSAAVKPPASNRCCFKCFGCILVNNRQRLFLACSIVMGYLVFSWLKIPTSRMHAAELPTSRIRAAELKIESPRPLSGTLLYRVVKILVEDCRKNMNGKFHVKSIQSMYSRPTHLKRNQKWHKTFMHRSTEAIQTTLLSIDSPTGAALCPLCKELKFISTFYKT